MNRSSGIEANEFEFGFEQEVSVRFVGFFIVLKGWLMIFWGDSRIVKDTENAKSLFDDYYY